MSNQTRTSAENPAPQNTQSVPADGQSVSAGYTLSHPQRQALDLLARGRSIRSAAREAGIGRSTLYRWLRDDPEFIGAYNLWNDELIESARARLASLINAAVDAMGRAIRKGDPRSAATLLKAMNVLTPRIPGPHEPVEVIERRKIAERLRAVTIQEAEHEVDVRTYRAQRPAHLPDM